jgi:hypothetical protein
MNDVIYTSAMTLARAVRAKDVSSAKEEFETLDAPPTMNEAASPTNTWRSSSNSGPQIRAPITGGITRCLRKSSGARWYESW